MKRQHAVILESIWETDSITTRFPASRTGLLTPLLTCFTLLSFSLLLGQIILSPTPSLPFSFWTRIFEFSKSKFLSSLLSDKKILSPTSTLQKYSKTILNFVLATKFIPISQKYSKSPFFPDLENFLLPCLPITYSCHRSINGVH